MLLYLLATDGNVKTLIYALSCAWSLSGNGMHILLFELKEEAHEYYAWCFSTVKCICIEVFSSFWFEDGFWDWSCDHTG